MIQAFYVRVVATEYMDGPRETLLGAYKSASRYQEVYPGKKFEILIVDEPIDLFCTIGDNLKNPNRGAGKAFDLRYSFNPGIVSHDFPCVDKDGNEINFDRESDEDKEKRIAEHAENLKSQAEFRVQTSLDILKDNVFTQPEILLRKEEKRPKRSLNDKSLLAATIRKSGARRSKKVSEEDLINLDNGRRGLTKAQTKPPKQEAKRPRPVNGLEKFIVRKGPQSMDSKAHAANKLCRE